MSSHVRMPGIDDIPDEMALKRAGYRFLGMRDWIAYGPDQSEVARVDYRLENARNECIRLAWVHYQESSEQ
jgi:hypothetical protein